MFILRLFSFIVLVTLFLLGIFLRENGLGKIIFVLGGIPLGFFAVDELLRMLKRIGKPSFRVLTPAFAAVIVGFSILTGTTQLPVLGFIFIVFILCCWIHMLFSKNSQIMLNKVVNSVGALCLLIVPLVFLAFLYAMGDGGSYIGRYYLLFLVIVTKIGDTGAYVVGTLSNKITGGRNHKIIPGISPKKSWEGTIGGMIISIGASLLLFFLLGDYSFLLALIAGFILFWGGFFGDLIESALKRTCGVKDSGNIIPGIGGVLDLLDSLVLNAPVFYFFIIFFKIYN